MRARSRAPILGDLVPQVVKLLRLADIAPRIRGELLDRDVTRGFTEQPLQRPVYFPDIASLVVPEVRARRHLRVDEVTAHGQRTPASRPLAAGDVLHDHRGSCALLAEDFD